MIPPEERCHRCFSSLSAGKSCFACNTSRFPFQAMAATFDYSGVAQQLLHKMKYGNAPWLAKTMAAFLAIQLNRLSWPKPDMLIPVPSSWLTQMERGYNPPFLLAKALGKWIGCPVVSCLKKTAGNFSQARLNRDQRKRAMHRIILRKKSAVTDKNVLLLDDVHTTGQTLKLCGNVVKEQGHAHSLYALTFCKTP